MLPLWLFVVIGCSLQSGPDLVGSLDRVADYYHSAGARGFATDQVTFDLLDVRGRRSQAWGQTSDGGNFLRSCELAESPATAVPSYYETDYRKK